MRAALARAHNWYGQFHSSWLPVFGTGGQLMQVSPRVLLAHFASWFVLTPDQAAREKEQDSESHDIYKAFAGCVDATEGVYGGSFMEPTLTIEEVVILVNEELPRDIPAHERVERLRAVLAAVPHV